MQTTGRLFVTGASGFLGWNLCQVASREWQVFGTYGTQPIAIPKTTVLPLDLLDFAAMKHLLETVQPAAVIHLAAQSNPNRCQVEPELAQAVNVTATTNLAGLCADRGISFIFSSTDLVFDGQHPPYTETDPVCPVNRYGEQKAIAETAVLQRHPSATVCRMPLMFGAAPPTARSFIQPFLNTLRSGQPLRLFTDEVRTPVSAESAAEGLLLALRSGQGCLHLGGQERISRYEFGQRLVEALELVTAVLEPCHQADVPMAAPRPADVSLNSELAFQLGYRPRSILEALMALRDQI